MKEWFRQNNIETGDEIVIQFLNKEKFIYRLIPERNFILKTKEIQHRFDLSENEQEASEKIKTLAQWIYLDKNKVVLNEYNRLTNALESEDRQYIRKSPSRARESAPANLRILLGDIYKGHCQLCNFWFFKRDKRPYFEIHHLDPFKGHHPKNLVVVCGNCHNQFEHADVKWEFDDNKWLIKVSFNQIVYSVRQVLLTMKVEPVVKEIFI
jgi:hypothetical protein